MDYDNSPTVKTATVLDIHGSAYLTLGVTIAILVLVPHCKLFWEILLNLLVG